MEKSLAFSNNTSHVENDETKGKYLTVWIDRQLYGMPISNVVSIVGVQKIVPVPEFPYYAKGVMNLRGSVIPIIDMRLRLNLPEIEYGARTCIIIATVRGQDVGFIVEGVNEVTSVGENNMMQAPSVGQPTGAYIEGVFQLDGELILNVSVEKLLSDGDLSTLSSAGM